MTAHAELYMTESGLMPIRESIKSDFPLMSDLELADKAFGDMYPDPEYYAELIQRDLAGPGISKNETYTRIDLKTVPAAIKTDTLRPH